MKAIDEYGRLVQLDRAEREDRWADVSNHVTTTSTAAWFPWLSGDEGDEEETSPHQDMVEDAWYHEAKEEDVDKLIDYKKVLDRYGFDKDDIKEEVYNYKRLWYNNKHKRFVGRNVVADCAEPKCSCGAKHTFLPDLHSDYCPLYKED